MDLRMSVYHQHQAAVLDACLRLADRGYLAGIGGNVALRIDEQLFAVTPSAADYYTLQPADICVLQLKTLKIVEANRQPSVESALHARLFRHRADALASVHTHQPIASAVALLNVPIPLKDTVYSEALGPRIEIVSYGPSGTPFLVRALARRLRPDINAYLLRNHGLICAGRSMEQGIANVEHVERAAAAFLRAAIEARSARQSHPSVTALALSALQPAN
jgi:L-fuculose-phosphate aldolase